MNIIKPEQYKETKSELLSRFNAFQDQFSKTLIVLSSGFLGLSFTILKFSSGEHPRLKSLLFTSWFCLASTAILMVVSFKVRERQIKNNIESLDYEFNASTIKKAADYIRKQRQLEKSGYFKKALIYLREVAPSVIGKFLQVVPILLFLIGIVSLAIFIASNW